MSELRCFVFFFFQAEDGIRDIGVTGVQTCALPILFVGAGNNDVFGGTGNDVIEARNGQIDNIDCGESPGDSDTANRDADENRVVGCERGQVGVLRIAPKAIAAEAGQTARLRLSWRHPVAWKQLRKVELRLMAD